MKTCIDKYTLGMMYMVPEFIATDTHTVTIGDIDLSLYLG